MVTIIKKLTGGAYPFYEYACLSTDIKPVSLVPENSICHEIDTGKHFYFGNGEWKELPPKGGSDGGSAYTLPTASADTKGGVKIGSGLTMTGEVLSATGGGAEKFVVTLTEENDTWTADKTVAEIVAADEANQVVVAKYPRAGLNIDIPLNMAVEYQGMYGAIFVGFVTSGNDNKAVTIKCMNEGSGDAITIIEQQIPTSSTAPLIVTLTAGEEAGQYVGNMTFAEIHAAATAGRTVVFVVNIEGDEYVMYCISSSVVVESSNTVYQVYYINAGDIAHFDGGASDYPSLS